MARIWSAGLVQEKGWQLVPALAEPTDCGGEIIDAGKVAAAERLAVDDGEEHFDQVEPGRRGRCEVQFDAGA